MKTEDINVDNFRLVQAEFAIKELRAALKERDEALAQLKGPVPEDNPVNQAAIADNPSGAIAVMQHMARVNFDKTALIKRALDTIEYLSGLYTDGSDKQVASLITALKRALK